MDILLKAEFNEGTMILSPASCVLNKAVCNDALQHVENNASLELIYEPELFSKIISNEKFNASLIDKSDNILFTGTVSVETSWQDVGTPFPIDKISLNIKDYTHKLRKKTKNEIALVNTTFNDVVNKLVKDCGLELKGDIPFIPIPYFVVQKNRNYLSLLDSFCFQYGCVFYFDEKGNVKLFNFSDIPHNPDSISATEILAPLRIKKTQKKYNSVTVNYNTLTAKTNELIFRESPKYDSNDQPLPIIIQPGVYYPFEASPVIESEEGVVEQSFSSGFAESKKKHNGEISFQRSKNTSLFYTTNHHVIEDWDGDIEIDRTNFTSLGASLRLKNKGSTDAKIWQFGIRADAVYRNATAFVTAGDNSIGESYSIESEFIFNSSKATELAKTLYKYSTFNNYKIDFSLDNKKIELGSFRKINSGESGYQCDALITGYSFDASKDLYLIKALSVSPATLIVSKNKEMVTSDLFAGENERLKSQLQAIENHQENLLNETIVELPKDSTSIGLITADDKNLTFEKPKPSFTAWQNKIIEYDCTDKDKIEMTFEEALHDVIILSGELKNDLTFQFFFDTTNLNGSKNYLIALKLIGEHSISFTTAIENTLKVKLEITNESYSSGCFIIVDFNGNIFHFRGEKGSGGLGLVDFTEVINDNDCFFVEHEKEAKKIAKVDALKVIQKFDSPLGEIKEFYDNDYKHGFLECNGMPFSPDIFPEFTEYVKKNFNTGIDDILGWQLRPTKIGNDGRYVFIKAVQGV